MRSKKTIIKMEILWTIVLIILMSNIDISAAHPSSHPSINNIDNDLIESILIPYDAYPGFEVKKFNSKLINYNKNDINKEIESSIESTFHLISNAFSSHFAILSDGLVMTTKNISDLLNQNIVIIIREDASPHYIRDRTLVLKVLQNTKNALKFNSNQVLGHINENEEKGSVVNGLEDLKVLGIKSKYPLKFSIISGNEENLFKLLTPYPNSTSFTLIANKPLDREFKPFHDLIIEVRSDNEIATTNVRIDVIDLNDNSPQFERSFYEFQIPSDTEPFTIIGNLSATDADKDIPSYHLTKRHPLFTLIPKTGQIMLIKKPNIKSYKLSVYASDNRKPSRLSPLLPVLVQVYENENTENITLFDVFNPTVSLIRHKRSVRPTKSYEYKESDGAVQGMIVFQLDKKHAQEVYKIETPNRWVNVDTSGAVKVKESWDYEQLGKEKTIDFWVYATGPHLNGM
jgi:hypothetical protein